MDHRLSNWTLPCSTKLEGRLIRTTGEIVRKSEVHRDEFGFVDPDDYFPEDEFSKNESNSYRSFEIPIDYSQSESVFVESGVDDSR